MCWPFCRWPRCCSPDSQSRQMAPLTASSSSHLRPRSLSSQKNPCPPRYGFHADSESDPAPQDSTTVREMTSRLCAFEWRTFSLGRMRNVCGDVQKWTEFTTRRPTALVMSGPPFLVPRRFRRAPSARRSQRSCRPCRNQKHCPCQSTEIAKAI
jgi:hypothetical protein